jgi:two-component system, cell cycle response regulator DivK
MPTTNEDEVKSDAKKIHILLVDDDEVMRRLFGGWLVTLGYEVIYALNGSEGRETARRLQPDLVLMDERMPVMDGMEASTRMKSEEPTKNIPIILFTNEDFSIEAEKATKELGIDAYVHKSTDFKIIKQVIKDVLEKKITSTTA